MLVAAREESRSFASLRMTCDSERSEESGFACGERRADFSRGGDGKASLHDKCADGYWELKLLAHRPGESIGLFPGGDAAGDFQALQVHDRDVVLPADGDKGP